MQNKKTATGQSAAAWFYGQPGFHGEASERPDTSTLYCEVCQKDMGRHCDNVPGVRKCDECRLRMMLAETPCE